MLRKFQKLSENKIFVKLITTCVAIACIGCMFVVNSFAADGAAMTPQEAAQSIFTTVNSSINVGSVVGIIAIALGAGIGLYLAWWAIRKVVRMVKAGLNGKLKV